MDSQVSSTVQESATVSGERERAGSDGRGSAATGDDERQAEISLGGLLVYGLLGLFFGVLLVKSEVVSWFRIQEMFRFDAFHMYGVIGSAVIVAAASVQVIKRAGLRTVKGAAIEISPKDWGRSGTRYWLGGTFFGLGWALLGACPGPMFALVGAGISVILVSIVGALLGTWVYAYLRPYLPH